ncbi:hypothetical protein C8R48DRAFT_745419 [Suillus tomentosus]|nr:hypothetical protein C8R48DRAFT_745419 [Suillus tomentosus]
MHHSCGFCGKEFGGRGGVAKHIAICPECRRKWEKLVEDTTDDEGGLPGDFSYDDSFSPLQHSHSNSLNPDEDNPTASKNQQVTVEDATDKEKDEYQKYKEGEGENEWAPFFVREEWELAEWLIKSLRQTQTEEFLKLPITKNRTQPSFHNNQSFLQKVDELLHGASWSCKKVGIQGNRTDETGQPMCKDIELWMCNPVECIKDLIGNPLFKDHMVYAPTRAYTDPAGHHWIINDMWTTDWWGNKQKELPKGATIASIILATDKTYLSQFRGNKTAWPAYLYISKIQKEKRQQVSARATVLIGYLPAGKLDRFTSDACSLAGRDSVEMTCADSLIQQCLMACCKENWCPKCLVVGDERGDPLSSPMCDPQLIKEVLEKWKNGQHPAEFEDYGLCTIYNPFWADLPHTDIFLAFMPDLLHQLHKGIFKDHLVKWCLDIIGEDKLDAHFKAIPNYPGLWHIKKGILAVKQWTGTQHKELQCLPRDTGCPVLIPSFTSQVLVNTLSVFHTNKNILLEHQVCEHFNIPKLHQLSHYVQSNSLFGTTNGFNTELPEQLHIDFAKEAHCASNKRDYKEQMAQWLQRQEVILLCSSYLEWLLQRSRLPTVTSHSDSDSEIEDLQTQPCSTVPANMAPTVHSLAKRPARPRQSIQHLVTVHSATMFLQAFRCFLQKHIPHNKIVNDSQKQWHIRAIPEVCPGPGQKPGAPAQFDMALISDDLRVAQVRIIFMLPHQFGTYSQTLAYVEWFTPLRDPDPSSGLHQVLCLTSIIHVDEIVCPCHLIPKMGQSVDHRWTSANAYELASDFYLNSYIDLDTFCAATMVDFN